MLNAAVIIIKIKIAAAKYVATHAVKFELLEIKQNMRI